MSDQVVLQYDAVGTPVSTKFAPTTSRPGQALYTDGAASGAPAQAGLVALGSDYGATPKAQVPKVDASGTLATTNAAIASAATPLASAASATGALVMGLAGLTPTPLQIDGQGNLVVQRDQLPTFSVVAAGVALASGKSAFALVNGSTTGKIVRLVALYVINSTVGTGLLASYQIYASELRPITGVSAAGTALTPISHDSADSPDSGVKTYTGATVTGDNQGPLRRWITSDYGLAVDATNSEPNSADQQGRFPWVGDLGGSAKPVTVRPGAGLHVKIASTASNGYVDVTCIFTVASS